MVQILEPRTASNVDDYFFNIFAPYLLKYLKNAKRVDLVWDIYIYIYNYIHIYNSLKKSGQRSKVVEGTRIPKKWKCCLRIDADKTFQTSWIKGKSKIAFLCYKHTNRLFHINHRHANLAATVSPKLQCCSVIHSQT